MMTKQTKSGHNKVRFDDSCNEIEYYDDDDEVKLFDALSVPSGNNLNQKKQKRRIP